MRRWRRLGALLQVNAGSSRRAGVSPREAFEALVARGERALAERVMTGASIQVVREALHRSGRTAFKSPAADA